MELVSGILWTWYYLLKLCFFNISSDMVDILLNSGRPFCYFKNIYLDLGHVYIEKYLKDNLLCHVCVMSVCVYNKHNNFVVTRLTGLNRVLN